MDVYRTTTIYGFPLGPETFLSPAAPALRGSRNVANEKFWAEFQRGIMEKDDIGKQLSSAPVVRPGGTQTDHYKGLASAMAVRLVPFMKASYEATEFVYGYLPVKNNVLPYLYFQCAVLDVKGKSIPGVGNFGAVLASSIPETYVSPYADWKHRLLPLSAMTGENPNAGKVFKSRPSWGSFPDAVNNDKAALKALGAPAISARMGDYKVTIDSLRPTGMLQLAPYKGHTLMTLETTPGFAADVNRPRYDFKTFHDAFLKIALHALAHPQRGEDVGQLFLNQSNAAMMDLMIKQADRALQTTAGAPPPTSPPPASPPGV